MPGPKYNHHIIDSMSVISQKKNPTSEHGFFNPYSKYDKIIEKGMEKYFYGRETKGPGAYLN